VSGSDHAANQPSTALLAPACMSSATRLPNSES
jgi:hypothetical protein